MHTVESLPTRLKIRRFATMNRVSTPWLCVRYSERFGVYLRTAWRDYARVMFEDDVSIYVADQWLTLVGSHLDLAYDPADCLPLLIEEV